MDEIQFRHDVAETIKTWGHRVFFHESPNEFSVHGGKGWVDLYVQTNPDWEHHDKFPVLGVETKLAKSIGWLVEAIGQVGKYNSDLKTATYTIQGKVVSTPTLFLVVTPDSWEDGWLYKWLPPELQPFKPEMKKQAEDMQWGCWFGLTTLYERLLMKNGATLLRRSGFFTNMHGNHGAVTRYDLRTRTRAEAV